MPVISRIVSMALRVGELAFGAIVAGIIGEYLHGFNKSKTWPQKRFIYTEVIAGVSILMALIWLLPFAGGFIHYPFDFVLALAWFAAFGLLVNALGPVHCGGVFHRGGDSHGGICGKWKASEAFSFLSAIFWLVSALLGVWFVHRSRRDRAVAGDGTAGTAAGTKRHAWYRRHRV